MVRFSSLGVLLMLPVVMTSSSWSTAVTRKAVAAGEPRQIGAVAMAALQQSSLHQVAAAIPENVRASSAIDAGLTFLMGGGLVAWQLRRAQKGVRMARVAIG
jgi:hypothetical protein